MGRVRNNICNRIRARDEKKKNCSCFIFAKRSFGPVEFFCPSAFREGSERGKMTAETLRGVVPTFVRTYVRTRSMRQTMYWYRYYCKVRTYRTHATDVDVDGVSRGVAGRCAISTPRENIFCFLKYKESRIRRSEP